MSQLSNYTFEEISIGQTARYSKTVEEIDIQLFAAACGDVNPLHLDARYAATTVFGECIAHGMLSGAIISAAIALELPGPGTVYLGQSLRFKRPVKIGDEITVELTVSAKREDKKFVTLDCKALNQMGKLVVSGTAEVVAPTQKIQMSRPALPQFSRCS